MNNSPIPPARYIRTNKQLVRLAFELASEPMIAIDTESNSLYAYRERVCLIQLSTRRADYIIDPLEEIDLSPLASLFANEQIEKVFHAAEYDLMTMKRDFGFVFRNLFDTMIAARTCGYKNIGLGTLLGEIVGVKMDKRHQRDDWGRRPLSPESLTYAQMDTHYLPHLRDFFHARLTALERWEETREAFADLTEIPAAVNGFNTQSFWRIAIPNHLTRRQSAVLREVHLLREEIAQQRDIPTFKVLSDKMLINIATSAPRTFDELTTVGIPAIQVRRFGKALLNAVQRGLEGNLPEPPEPEPAADPVVIERYTALREWRKERAAQRGVESDVIVSKDALWALAEKAPATIEEMRDVRGLGPWRLEQYGGEILEVIKRYE
jgi:ribonuclease D